MPAAQFCSISRIGSCTPLIRNLGRIPSFGRTGRTFMQAAYTDLGTCELAEEKPSWVGPFYRRSSILLFPLVDCDGAEHQTFELDFF